eukprot:11168818-Lingulodinium_polyedra.AAC.1
MTLLFCLRAAVSASDCSPARSRARARAFGMVVRGARGLPASSRGPATLPVVGSWWPCPTAAMAWL